MAKATNEDKNIEVSEIGKNSLKVHMLNLSFIVILLQE